MRRACARLTVLDFTEFTLSQLPAAPQRVLEVGCGREGGVAPELARAGYDVLAIDPDAPDGPLYRRVTLEELDDPGPFDAVVAGRVLHHVHPLGAALDKLAGLAPLLVLDEFAWNHMDEPTVDWYESQHRLLVAAGRRPKGPPDLAEWRERHAGLHSYETLRAELDARYEAELFEWRPYLYRWLDGPASEALESALIDAGAIRPIGVRYVGRTSSKRAPSASRS
jgi:SAM-dependent methyltransferase